MPTNKEWLYSLTPAELTAWFDSERECRDVSLEPMVQFYCSLCGCTVDVPLLWGELNYCPDCGRKVVRHD